ncbi:MAG: hypothetical protein PHW63_03630 [Alphaproteobacteria bacterium]|nr:hypothetical protein [Alphaproteobacteria bacterium]
MNFFNDKNLGLRLKEGKVSSKEKFLYLLAFVFISSIFLSYTFLSYTLPENINMWDTYTDIAELLINLFGTFWCYRTNRSGDDKDFIERFICIGFPIGVQAIVLGIGATLLLGIIFMTTNTDIQETSSSSVYSLLATTLVALYFYTKMNSTLKLFANK